MARNSHALSTKYNILYNGGVGLNKGMKGVKEIDKDNFWKRLPVEKMDIRDELLEGEKPKNADFELAEAKATKAIQKHSMNIGGREKNSQIDEAYLLLGQARYYDQRFIPALEAFNYILYKYPTSSNIHTAKIWREKTNMRLGNDALVIKNINKLIEDKKLSKQVYANANALLAASFLNLEEKDSALVKLKIAENYTKINSEKARYRFILGQLYEELGEKDSAILSYKSVIAMKRKADRAFTMQSHARISQLFDFEKGDTTMVLTHFKKLIEDRENRPFLDLIYHQMGVFEDKQNHQNKAIENYNVSLKKAKTDQYLSASNFRNIGNIFFKNAEYSIAAKYYDSTLVKLDPKTREFASIQKTRKNLDDVIKFETLSKRNDSILNVTSMSENDKNSYFENHINTIKKADELKRIAEAKETAKQAILDSKNKNTGMDPGAFSDDIAAPTRKAPVLPPSVTNINSNQTGSTFYFYNPNTVAFGKLEFKKLWGERSANGNWRISSSKNNLATTDIPIDATAVEKNAVEEKIIEKYTVDFYLNQLPKSQTAIDSIAKERNSVYYELGVIYKERFKEYDLASAKLEQLLKNNPEEKLVLPTLYNLYKIYQIRNLEKAADIKKKITDLYPNSRYALIINNPNPNEALEIETPETFYNAIYKEYTDEKFVEVLSKIDVLIKQFSGEEILPKFELLKATVLGKLEGLMSYKKGLQFVTDTYPNSAEGKAAKEILTSQIPALEKMDFSSKETNNWNILYQVGAFDDKNTLAIIEKIKAYKEVEKMDKLSYSIDIYTEKENFICIHGFKNQGFANETAMVLGENKKYKITAAAIIISSNNYKVIQIKKNLNAYLNPKK